MESEFNGSKSNSVDLILILGLLLNPEGMAQSLNVWTQNSNTIVYNSRASEYFLQSSRIAEWI